jgi:UbiD family decarboxylase
MPIVSYKDFRGFLEILKQRGQLVRIEEEVFPEPDIRAASRAASDIPNGPAVYFEKIRGYAQPVVTNVHGSFANQALMLGVEKNTSLLEQFFELNRRWQAFPIKPIKVTHAPLKEKVIDGSDLNLFKVMPLFKVNKWDGGCYIAKGCVVSRDIEDEKIQNVGLYRLQVKNENTLGIQALPFHDIGIHILKAEKQNKPLPVAITIGNDPIVSFIASTPLKYEENEYDMIGALRGEPAEIIHADTVDLEVPAGAEYVLEGEVIPRVRKLEGPFGEFIGSYSAIRMMCEIKIKRITHRENPIFEGLYIGTPRTETDYLVYLNTSVPLYQQIKESLPEVVSVNAGFAHGVGTIISTKSRLGGWGKVVAFRLLSTPHGLAYAKIIIIVDETVDPFNLDQVMLALATRVSPDKDVVVIPNCAGMPLDPSCTPVPGMHAKLIIDATTPVPPAEPLHMLEATETPPDRGIWRDKILDLMK